MWQELIVGVCVSAAVLFLLRQYWPGKKRDANGHQCHGCSNDSCGKPSEKDSCSTH